MAHLREQGINFVVFDADARSRTKAGRSRLLRELTFAAKQQGLRVEKSALAFSEHGQPTFFGTPDLVRFLKNCGVPRWTHQLSV